MIRHAVRSILLLLLAAHAAPAQEWARKMFQVTRHDFGTVARGSKAEFNFSVTNLYKEEVHIASVRTSCGCTTPRIVNPTLKTFEKGAIAARYNTGSFTGARSATITVVIDKPYYAEVQLSVDGYIRSDVVFHPGVVEFGSVDMGTARERKITVDYAGRNDWQVTDVRSASEHIEVEIKETKRAGGRVGYDMLVRLKENAPGGYINDRLILVTNDRRSQEIPLNVRGRVTGNVTVSPAALSLGVLQPGEKVTKRLVVRGKQPFRIVDIKCPDGCFEFKTTQQAKSLHLIPVTFTAGKKSGKVAQTIEIKTDLGGGCMTSLIASATVTDG